MLIYLAMLLVPLFGGLVQPELRNKPDPGFWTYFLVLLIFCGFRSEIGPDWLPYLNLYEISGSQTWEEILTGREPGYYLIAKASAELGWGFQGSIFISSLIFLYGCFRYAERTCNPWLALAAVMPYLVFVISTSGLRQSCAIGVEFLLLASWHESRIVRKLLLAGLAISFHTTAVVLLLFVILDMRMRWTFRLFLGLCVAGVVAYAMQGSDSIDRYASVYVQENLASEGAFFHVLLIAFPAALYLKYYKKIDSAGVGDANVLLASALTLVLMLFLPLSSTGIDRLTLYFSFVQMWAYPALLRVRPLSLGVARTGFTAIVLATFFVYFMFGAQASAYVPYKTILMD